MIDRLMIVSQVIIYSQLNRWKKLDDDYIDNDSDSYKMNMWVDYIDRDIYVCIYDSYLVNW